jgi:hypothetical protein
MEIIKYINNPDLNKYLNIITNIGLIINSMYILKSYYNYLIKKFKKASFYDKRNNRIILQEIESKYNISNILNQIDEERDLEIVINSDGGDCDEEKKIISKLIDFKNSSKKINIYIPLKCYSASVSVMLTGDNIFANNYANFSQFDVQINHQKTIAAHYYTQNNGNYMIGYARDVLREQKKFLDLLRSSNKNKYDDEKWDSIIDDLCLDPKFTHEYKYSICDIKKIGIEIDGFCPNEIKSIILPITFLEKLSTFVYFLKLYYFE